MAPQQSGRGGGIRTRFCCGRRINVSSAYVSTVSMFEKSGFTRVLKTESLSANLARLIMRLQLQDQTAPGDG